MSNVVYTRAEPKPLNGYEWDYRPAKPAYQIHSIRDSNGVERVGVIHCHLSDPEVAADARCRLNAQLTGHHLCGALRILLNESAKAPTSWSLSDLVTALQSLIEDNNGSVYRSRPLDLPGSRPAMAEPLTFLLGGTDSSPGHIARCTAISREVCIWECAFPESLRLSKVIVVLFEEEGKPRLRAFLEGAVRGPAWSGRANNFPQEQSVLVADKIRLPAALTGVEWPRRVLVHQYDDGVLPKRKFPGRVTSQKVETYSTGPQRESPLTRQLNSVSSRKRANTVPEQLALVTAHYNPQHYSRPLRNYWEWRVQLGALQKCLTTVELSFDDHFAIHDSLKIRGGPANLMWQKEALINRVVRHLPKHVRYIAWIDHDIVFPDTTWAHQACRLLDDTFGVVQLYSHVRYLDDLRRCYAERPGRVWSHQHENRDAGSLPGGAWAMHRDVWDKMGGLLEIHVVGGGDRTVSDAWVGVEPVHGAPKSPAMLAACRGWVKQARAALDGRRVGYIPTTAMHLFHGMQKKRYYRKRANILLRHDFDPATDIRYNADGILEWTSVKPEMHREIADYFASREEDE